MLINISQTVGATASQNKKKIISQYKVPPWPKGFLKIKNAQANKHS